MYPLVFWFLIVFAAGPSFGSVTCTDVDGTFPYRYCVWQEAPIRTDKIVYVLHGLGGSAESWSRSADFKAIVGKFRATGQLRPRMVSVSFAPFWLLLQPNLSTSSGMMPFFVNEVMPRIESALGLDQPQRFLIGFSMGGFNASMLYLRHPELFHRVFLGCPALSELSPFSTEAQIKDFINQTKADVEIVRRNIRLAKLFYDSNESWLKDSPLGLLRSQKTVSSSKIYISCGRSDQHGFYPGANRFSELIRQKGGLVHWTSLAGGHCTYDQKALLNFLF